MSTEESKIKTVAAEAIGFIEGMAAAGHFGSGPNPDFIRMCKILDDWRAVLNGDEGEHEEKTQQEKANLPENRIPDSRVCP